MSAMVWVSTIITACWIAIYVTAAEREPYLVIRMVHNQKSVHAIHVDLGQNVSLDCTANPNYHSVLWQTKNKQINHPKRIATLNLFHIRKSDFGTYTCVSPRSKLRKQVRVIQKKRYRRDDSSDLNKQISALLADENVQEDIRNMYNSIHNPPEQLNIENSFSNYEHQLKNSEGWTHNIHTVVLLTSFVTIITSVCACICRSCKKAKHPQTINSGEETEPSSTPNTEPIASLSCTSSNEDMQALLTPDNEPEFEYIESLPSNPEIQILVSPHTESEFRSVELIPYSSPEETVSLRTLDVESQLEAIEILPSPLNNTDIHEPLHASDTEPQLELIEILPRSPNNANTQSLEAETQLFAEELLLTSSLQHIESFSNDETQLWSTTNTESQIKPMEMSDPFPIQPLSISFTEIISSLRNTHSNALFTVRSKSVESFLSNRLNEKIPPLFTIDAESHSKIIKKLSYSLPNMESLTTPFIEPIETLPSIHSNQKIISSTSPIAKISTLTVNGEEMRPLFTSSVNPTESLSISNISEKTPDTEPTNTLALFSSNTNILTPSNNSVQLFSRNSFNKNVQPLLNPFNKSIIPSDLNIETKPSASPSTDHESPLVSFNMNKLDSPVLPTESTRSLLRTSSEEEIQSFLTPSTDFQLEHEKTLVYPHIVKTQPTMTLSNDQQFIYFEPMSSISDKIKTQLLTSNNECLHSHNNEKIPPLILPNTVPHPSPNAKIQSLPTPTTEYLKAVSRPSSNKQTKSLAIPATEGTDPFSSVFPESKIPSLPTLSTPDANSLPSLSNKEIKPLTIPVTESTNFAKSFSNTPDLQKQPIPNSPTESQSQLKSYTKSHSSESNFPFVITDDFECDEIWMEDAEDDTFPLLS